MCLRRGWAREGQNEREKKERDGSGVEGEKGGICESWTTNEQAMSQQGHLHHTHMEWAWLLFLCSLSVCCVLCAPTHEPTYLSPINLCCVSVYFVCVREILARPLWFNPCLLCVCACAHVFFSVPHHTAMCCVCVTTPNLSSVTRALLSDAWIICLYPISNVPSNGYYQLS